MENCKRKSEEIENEDDNCSKKLKIIQINNDKNVLKSVENYDYLLDDIDEEDFSSDLCSNFENSSFDLDLSNWKRCRIISANKLDAEYVLVVEECKSKKKALCKLMDSWYFSKFDLDGIVSMYGKYNAVDNSYLINRDHGFFVVAPDILISGTSVVAASYCRRKGILMDSFKGLDPEFSKYMASGIIMHEIFQTVLKCKLQTTEEIRRVSINILNSREVMNLLYASSMSEDDMFTEMEKFVPKIVDFVENHIVNQSKTDIQIESIEDIEENIWCPELGLKGKIDVTIKAKNEKGIEEIMPLEIKTGKASFSIEHTGQLALYDMMMNAIGYKVNKGMLLYLRENKIRSFPSSRHTKRDLIMLRNEISYYLNQKFPYKPGDSIENCMIELPVPLDDYRTCGYCSFNKVCTTFAKKDDTLVDMHSLKLLYKDKHQYLTNQHMDYFIRWSGLIYLEYEEFQSNMKDIWTELPEKRFTFGRALINLKLNEKVAMLENRYLHTFISKSSFVSDSDENILGKTMQNGDYVIVSTSKRIAVASGKVVEICKNLISVNLERDLTIKYLEDLFHIDKYDSNSMKSFNLTNLGFLLEDNEDSSRLRSILIDKKQPLFNKKLPGIVQDLNNSLLDDLNKFQKRAILMALATDSFCLFKGLPGTGKTQTVTALVRLLVSMNKTVILTSHTHSAVDNVLKRLVPFNLKFMRLGSITRIEPCLKPYCEAILTEDCKTTKELIDIYNSYKIFGVTVLGASHSIVTQKKFDYCIIDEATQVFQCSAIRAMINAKKYVLIGDPNQLPPVIKSKTARELGASESIFSRLDSETATFVLPLQYRMNKFITKVANELTYKGELQCANDSVSKATIKFSSLTEIIEKRIIDGWLKRVISPQMAMSVIFLNTSNTFDKCMEFMKKNNKTPDIQKNLNYVNVYEAALVFYLINVLLNGKIKENEIGIIAPFRAQVDFLKNHYLENFRKQQECEAFRVPAENIDINTVDQFQGKDKEIIIYSCTRTRSLQESSEKSVTNAYEILEDHRRLTVAVTRAKHKLIIIGDVETLQKYTPFKSLIQSIPSCAKIQLMDGMAGFDWKDILNDFQYN